MKETKREPWYWQYDQPDQEIVVDGSGTIMAPDHSVGHIHRGEEGRRIVDEHNAHDELVALLEDAHEIIVAVPCSLPEADPAVQKAREWMGKVKSHLWPAVQAAFEKDRLRQLAKLEGGAA